MVVPTCNGGSYMQWWFLASGRTRRKAEYLSSTAAVSLSLYLWSGIGFSTCGTHCLTYVAWKAVHNSTCLCATASKAEPELDCLTCSLLILFGKLGCYLQISYRVINPLLSCTTHCAQNAALTFDMRNCFVHIAPPEYSQYHDFCLKLALIICTLRFHLR